MVSEPEKRKEMGVQARQAATAYSVENTTRLLLTQYQKMIDESAGIKLGLRARLTLIRDRFIQ